MNVRQYKLRRSVEDGHYEEKTCWLDRLDLHPGNRVTLDSCPDWMWWDVVTVYDPIMEFEQINYTRPEKKEEVLWGWVPQTR